MLLGHLPNHFIGNPGADAQPRQVDLPHFSAAAHAVHQKEGLSFAANESHDFTLKLPFLL
jgi:hypothetical protein